MNNTFDARVQLKRDTKEAWERNDPVLLNGEMIIVDFPDGSHKNKTGDGVSRYSALLFDGATEYSKHIKAALSPSAWSGNSQRVAMPGLTSGHNGVAAFSQSITPEQYVAAVNAQLRVKSQENGYLTITAYGAVPSVTIPIDVILLAAADSSVAIQAMLSHSAWSGKQQSVAVPGVTAGTNGVASISESASADQINAASAAKLRLVSQSTNTMTFAADGAVPGTDIPITIILLSQEG